MLINFTVKEKQLLKKVSTEFGFNMTQYIKLKLFDENEDMLTLDERYISPQAGKHNVFIATALYKMIALMIESLKVQGVKPEEVMELERQALEYARRIREKYGYKVIRSIDE